MSTEELEETEKYSFLAWRRSLARLVVNQSFFFSLLYPLLLKMIPSRCVLTSQNGLYEEIEKIYDGVYWFEPVNGFQ